MNDDLERRLHESLRSAELPDAPSSLRNSLSNLPVEDQTPTRPAKSSVAWLVPALAVGLLAAVVLGVLGTNRPTPTPSGSAGPTQTQATESPTPIASPGPTDAPVTTSANAIAFFDADHGLLSGSSGSDESPTAGVVWRSADGGNTWSIAARVPVAFTSLALAGPSRAWAGVDCAGEVSPCAEGVWESADAGSTWHQVSTTPVDSLAFAGATHGWATQSGPAPGQVVGELVIQLLATTDGGRTWTILPNPCAPGIGWPVAVAFPDASHGWVGCTSNGASTNAKGVMATQDGGKTWTVRSAVRILGEGPSVGTINFADYLVGLAMRADGTGIWWGGRGVTERTADGGATWSETAAGRFDIRIPSTASLADDRHWFVVLWDGDLGSQVLVETSDGGETWNRLALLLPH